MREKLILNTLTFIYIFIAAFWDYKYKKIPNKLNFPVIIMALVLNFSFFGVTGLKLSIFGFVIGLFILLIPFALGGVGAGDVKFLAGIGALKGHNFVIWDFLIFSIIYFFVSIIYLFTQKELIKKVKAMVVSIYTKTPITGTIYDKNGSVSFPIGIIIAIGTILTEIFLKYYSTL